MSEHRSTGQSLIRNLMAPLDNRPTCWLRFGSMFIAISRTEAQGLVDVFVKNLADAALGSAWSD
jgi:hypothetical protein